MSDFFKPLTKGTEEIISQTPVEPDKLRFTTDTGKLFFDTENGRLEISDIEKNLTDMEIKQLGTYGDKIYIGSDTSRAYVYNKTLNQLMEIGAGSVVDMAINTTQPDPSSPDEKIASIKWTRELVAEEIGKLTKLDIKVVETLPETGVTGTIYFVPVDAPGQTNVYEEYMWIDNTWEMLGTSKIDLTGYFNTVVVNGTGSFISSVASTGSTITFTKSNTGTISYATNAGTASKATNADTASYASNADSATNASSATYATNAGTAANATNASSASYASHGIESIELDSGSTFKVTRSDGSTFSFTQLDPGSAEYSYQPSNGIQVTDDRKIRNLGVLSAATGSSNGTIKVTTANTNGETSATDVAVKGLGNLAYLSSTTATTATYATNAGTATRATNANTASYATSAGNAQTATLAASAATAGHADDATNADTATYAANAGTASYASAPADSSDWDFGTVSS